MMQYIYDDEKDDTAVVLDGEEQGTLSGKPTQWRGPIPHPDSSYFGEFEEILRQINSRDERELMLHIIAGTVERVGFDSEQS